MPNELENRLGRALRSIPLTGQSRERARQVALDALTPPPPSRRPVAVKVLVASIAAACLISAGVALAASGGVEFHVGRARSVHHPDARQAGNRLVSSPSGLGVLHRRGRRSRLDRRGALPASGCGTALRDRCEPRRPLRTPGKGSSASRGCLSVWASRVHTPCPGRVIAASWSPLPIRIAFLAQTPSGYVMHDMWGTGSHDRRGPGLASPVAPSWRWDSLAVAFVRANGRVAILSPTSGAVETLPRSCSIRSAQAIAYSPSNGLLAIAGRQAARDRGYDGVAAASLHPARCGDAVAGVARRSAARHRCGQPPSESQHRLVWCAIDCRDGARKHREPRAGSTGTWDRDRDRPAAGHERPGRDG